MESIILKEISKLRNGKPMYGDFVNNRYCVDLLESDGSRTSYCFSTPVYKSGTNMLLKPAFLKDGEVIHMEGSSAVVNIGRDISLRDKCGEVKIITDATYEYLSEDEVRCGDRHIYPSLNGITCSEACGDGKDIRLNLEVNEPTQIRVNDKCFAFMLSQYTPLMTVSCIGGVDGNGIVAAPAVIDYEQTGEMSYELTIRTSSGCADSVLFEINMYEPKLFQDTTVESNNPQCNNAFGGTAFIGNTELYGEQWLYIRPEMSKIADVSDENAAKAFLHLPAYQMECQPLKIYSVSRRFCSFGSNWNNKVTSKLFSTGSITSNGYVSFDITEMYTDRALGYIVKPERRNGGFACVSTGDNYCRPVILELRTKD